MEVRVDNVESALLAEKYGAARIELCSALDIDGLTPNYGMFQVLQHALKIPIHVMIRPRKGNFFYSEIEYESMKIDILNFKKHNADGFVFGILTQDKQIDMVRNKELLAMCHPLPATFHRAFDLVPDSLMALTQIYELGFKYLLTSGGQENVTLGMDMITKLNQMSLNMANGEKKLTIMPGGGINKNNLETILKVAKCRAFHSSCKNKESKGYLLEPEIVKDFKNIAEKCGIFKL